MSHVRGDRPGMGWLASQRMLLGPAVYFIQQIFTEHLPHASLCRGCGSRQKRSLPSRTLVLVREADSEPVNNQGNKIIFASKKCLEGSKTGFHEKESQRGPA